MLASRRTIERLRTLLVGLVDILKLDNSYNNALGSNCLELSWATNKSSADLVYKFCNGNEIAHTKTEAHGQFKHSIVACFLIG